MGKEELSYVVSYCTLTEVGAAGLAEGVVVVGLAGAALVLSTRSAAMAVAAEFFMLLRCKTVFGEVIITKKNKIEERKQGD